MNFCACRREEQSVSVVVREKWMVGPVRKFADVSVRFQRHSVSCREADSSNPWSVGPISHARIFNDGRRSIISRSSKAHTPQSQSSNETISTSQPKAPFPQTKQQSVYPLQARNPTQGLQKRTRTPSTICRTRRAGHPSISESKDTYVHIANGNTTHFGD